KSSEIAAEERVGAQEELLRTLSVGLHPVLLVEPLTTVGEVTKWYSLQLEKSYKNYKRRKRQERQRVEQSRSATSGFSSNSRRTAAAQSE
ncbi:unnamed protein product, partial [Laminaria digitata]